MKLQGRTLLIAGGAFLSIVLLAASFAVGSWMPGDDAAAQDVPESGDTRSVDVNGTGEVSVSPDTGMVRLGVQVTNENADAALEEANQTIDAVTAAIQELGIEEDDITTGSFSIWPEYDYENDRQEVVGYRVNHIVSVKVRDIGLTGDVVSTGVDAGANSVETVSFIVEDNSAALDQARELAFENARQKGEKLAGLAESSLGPVINISEQTYTPGPVQRDIPEEEAADQDAGSVPFNPEDTIVSVDIQVSWELQ